MTESTPHRVLIVDDSRFIRRIEQLLLEERGEFKVVGSAADGEEGLAKALELKPDVIVLDIDMPRMNGFEMLKRLRETSDVPVVLVTALPTQSARVKIQAAALDVFKVVPKSISDQPLDLSLFGDELISTVRSAALHGKKARATT